MARLLARSSSQRFLYASGNIVVAYPFTFGCRARFASKPSSSSMWMMGCFKSGGSGVDNGHYFGWENASNQNELQCVSTTNDDWSTGSKFSGGSVPGTGTWFNIAAGFFSSTNRNLYLNGNFAGADSNSRAFGTPDQFIIGAYLSGAGSYVATFDGDIADVFILSRGATDAELDAYNAGFSPLDIWPASDILEYIPMLGSTGDEVGYKGRTFVQAGTGSIASSSHPNTGLYYPVSAPTIEHIAPVLPGIDGEGGAIAGGSALLSSERSYVGAGGAVAGGDASGFIGEGGAVIGGAASYTTEYNVNGTGGAVAGGSSAVQVFTPITIGESHVTVYNPSGVAQGTVTPLRYRLSRFENQVGEWECDIPVDEDITAGVPLAANIAYGWKIAIQQENFSPNNSPDEGYLLYQGIVEDRSFRISQGGSAFLAMKGSFRTYEIVRRSVLQNLEYDGNLLTLTNTLVGSLAGGPIYFDAARLARTTLKGSFTDLSRYAAWVRGATLGRHVIRESWNEDRPEIVPYDGQPASGITFRPLNDSEKGGSAAAYAARYAHETGTTGVAIIAGTPTVNYIGTNVVNRIIAKGVDTVADPDNPPDGTMDAVLTLQHASLASPYPVKAGVNPDSTIYYYIEDTDSIAAYGLTEVVLTFSDVRNPNNLTESRRRAANVLYMRAVNELIKRRSEKLEISLPPIANGARTWGLPGDQCQFEYTGVAQTADGSATWIDEDRRMLITQRHEESHGSGIRRVSYVLAAPEMEFPVPGLPGEIVLPPDDGGGGPGDDPGGPDAPGSEPCCGDPNGDENEGPDDEFGDNFPEPEGAFGTWVRDPLGFIVSGSSVNSVPWNRRSSGTLEPDGGWNIYTLPSLGPGSFSVSGQLLISVSGFEMAGDWTVRLVVNGVPGDPLLAGSQTTHVPSGGNNQVDGVTPNVVWNGLSAGDVVWMEVIAPPGPSFAALMEGHITISFTPA